MRTLAAILLALALIALGRDLAPLAQGGAWEDLQFIPLGEVWFRIHPDSYQLLEPAISRHVSPWLWDYLVLPLMTTPVGIVLAVLALLAWVLRPRRDEDRRRRRTFRRR